VTEPVPNPDLPGEAGLPAPPTPSLAKRLRSDATTLAGMRSQVARAERANPSQRERILGGAPLAQIVQGLQEIEAIVAADRARLAYVKAHPGILPAE
jgi:hypothetical protein